MKFGVNFTSYFTQSVQDATYRRCRRSRGEGQSIAMSVSVCLSVCQSVCWHMSKTTGPNYTKFSVHVIWSRGSVLFWWHCNTLRTSGFVMTSCFLNEPCGAWRSQCQREGRSGHQIVINFRRIHQVAPQRLTLSSYIKWRQTAHRWQSVLCTMPCFHKCIVLLPYLQ